MNKGLMTICILVGSTIGSYLPVLFGQSVFSLASIFFGGVGGVAGIWAAVKLSAYM